MPGRGRPPKLNGKVRGRGRGTPANDGKAVYKIIITTLELGVERAGESCSWVCCKCCNGRFSASELRVSYRDINEQGMAAGSRYWLHLDCLSKFKTSTWRSKVSEVSPEKIHGFDALTTDDQATISALLSKMAAERPAAKKASVHTSTDSTAASEAQTDAHLSSSPIGQEEIEEESPVATPERKKRSRPPSKSLDDVQADVPKPEKKRGRPSKSLDDVQEEAKKLNLLVQLERLAARPEIAALGLPKSGMLAALTAASGSVVHAKKSLLGNQPGGA